MEVLAIIPARGGSKSIPRKNIKPLCGKPLLGYTIEAAIGSESIARTVVSTDDEEIKSYSIKKGAEVIARPLAISGDKATSEQALLHVLDFLQDKENYVPEVIVFLQCTSPFTRSKDIKQAISKYMEDQADSLFSASEFHGMLWHKINDNMEGINHDKTERLMRQDMGKQFLENGSIYIMNTKGFKEAKNRFFGKTSVYLMEPLRSVEIDENSDWIKAEFLMQFLNMKDQQQKLPERAELIIFDFDGVFTDNRVIVLPNGEEAVVCDRSDGMGISGLKKANIRAVVVSSEKNPVLMHRCKKLGLECYHSIDNKLIFLKEYLETNKISEKNILYIGNDMNDIECMKFAGCSVAVNNAFESVKKIADIVLKRCGGYAAVRELCDLLIERQKNGTKSSSRNRM